ncbi:MAG: hypothetical protein ACREQ2_00855 [Candidatus Binatia bacterium]
MHQRRWCHRWPLSFDDNQDYSSRKAARVGLMKEQSVERLMDIILQMKINLAHVNETLLQQTYEIREQLGEVFDEEKRGLERCLNAIDEKLEECSTFIGDYQRLHANLTAMREKLVQLGGEPGALPPGLPTEGVENIIAWRLQQLKDKGTL